MKITLFTSNHKRHIYLINSLKKVCSQLNVILETTTLYHGSNKTFYNKSKIKEIYFKKVRNAESLIFRDNDIKLDKKINIKILQYGDLNFVKKNDIKKFLQSDIYIVFGSSFIKGWLLNYLVKKKAINIHMGVSPYYKGADCNFWALYDNNFDHVGSTVHLLNKNLDGGPILYNAVSEFYPNPFIYSMSTTKSVINSLLYYISNKKIHKIKPLKQNKELNIRFSKKKDFTDSAIRKYLKRTKSSKVNIKIPKLKDVYTLKVSKYFK